MLEPNKNFNIQINDLKDFVTVTFVIIDDFYQKVTPTYIKNRRNIDKAIMSDSEIITLSIVGELLTIDSEKAWFGFCTKTQKIYFQNSVQELDFIEQENLYLKSSMKSTRR